MTVIAEIWRDAIAAVAALTCLGVRAPAPERQRLGRATLFFPLVGALLGAFLVAVNRSSASCVAQSLRSAVLVGTLAALSGGGTLHAVARLARNPMRGQGVSRRPGGIRSTARAVMAVAAVLILKTLALGNIAGLLETYALILAPVLGRWAPVVVAYGAQPIAGVADDRLLIGRVTFREFGWASTAAFVLALSIADGVGLVAVMSAALVATGLRVYVYRRAGRMSANVLGAAIEVMEIAVFVLLAVLTGLGDVPTQTQA